MNNCSICQNKENIKWKTFDEKYWWITCDYCGQTSKPQTERTNAINAWNELNETYVPLKVF
jgi:hypothetical protein